MFKRADKLENGYIGVCRWLLNVSDVLVFIYYSAEGGDVFASVCLSVCLTVHRITAKLVSGF